ncbi:Uncharacterised protein [Vibrio cholerae]|nr:Uncharacterised protein [Vibrio cholerae]
MQLIFRQLGRKLRFIPTKRHAFIQLLRHLTLG